MELKLKQSGKTGVLLVNMGTPETPSPVSVDRYLREFLMDKRVLDIPAPLRWFLVNFIIVPKRRWASARAYQKIWTRAGSPLLVNTMLLRQEVQGSLGDMFQVEVGMRYGQPGIGPALEKLAHSSVSEIIVLPLYPQYAESTTGSSIEECERWRDQYRINVPVRYLGAFFDDPGFLLASAETARSALKERNPEHVLFSFHGLPERHVQRADQSKNRCLVSSECCSSLSEVNHGCYRAQCYETARRIAQNLGLSEDKYSIGFQSRMGRTPWIAPYTEELIVGLAQRGIKKLAVLCPSFTADCLETIEEIGVRGKRSFLDAGGVEFDRIDCLNAHPRWVEGVCNLITKGRCRRD